MKNIAFIAPYSWIGVSSPLINTAIFLANKGHQIDIYTVFDKTTAEKGINNFDFNNKKINVFILRKNTFQKIKSKLDGNNYYSFFLSKIDTHNYDLLIAFDLKGLRIAAQLSKKTGIKYIFFSLEIENPNQISSRDRVSSKNAILTITQHASRRTVLSKLYGIGIENIYILPNAPIGAVLKAKKKYFHQNLDIPKEKLIVLVTGTLGKDHCVDKIINTVLSWEDDYVCVLHGWFVDDISEKLFIKVKDEFPDKIFYSGKMLPFHEKYTIFQSVDIGLVAFDPYNDNFKYASGAAGKLYDFLCCGVPIVANDIPNAKELIEQPNSGLIVDKFSQLPFALEKIISSYEYFSENCYKNYQKYEFSRNFDYIYQLFENSNSSILDKYLV